MAFIDIAKNEFTFPPSAIAAFERIAERGDATAALNPTSRTLSRSQGLKNYMVATHALWQQLWPAASWDRARSAMLILRLTRQASAELALSADVTFEVLGMALACALHESNLQAVCYIGSSVAKGPSQPMSSSALDRTDDGLGLGQIISSTYKGFMDTGTPASQLMKGIPHFMLLHPAYGAAALVAFCAHMRLKFGSVANALFAYAGGAPSQGPKGYKTAEEYMNKPNGLYAFYAKIWLA